ncbi:hypothetical protein [Curtobacterium sp. SL109]|uniref:hypothetical protein n=1 Tax=Curtobacterium sp. SL109 TaxID=2994662 RepID=UPI002275C8EB|nr:hypothetical protein [Curtobacterium sp. SL109]MCY1695343.1 hypothetical protein [Curtobacterium sp. SL109]
MRLREIDTGGWVRLLGPGLLAAGLWTLLAVKDFALAPVVVVLVAAAVLVVLVAAVVTSWAVAGGYRQQRRLEAWVRGSDLPAEVPVPVRIRYLRRVTERGAWVGWVSLAAGLLNAVGGVTTVFEGEDPWSSVFSFVAAVSFTGIGVSTLVFARRSMPRARRLLAEDEREQADTWFERHDAEPR